MYQGFLKFNRRKNGSLCYCAFVHTCKDQVTGENSLMTDRGVTCSYFIFHDCWTVQLSRVGFSHTPNSFSTFCRPCHSHRPSLLSSVSFSLQKLSKWVQGLHSRIEDKCSVVQSMFKVSCKVKLIDGLNLSWSFVTFCTNWINGNRKIIMGNRFQRERWKRSNEEAAVD